MSETKFAPLPVPRRISGPLVVDTSSLCHGVDRVSRVAICDQTPAQNLLGFVDPQWAETVVQALNSFDQLQADSKKLREPATCNAGHKSNLPFALWDCPVCTQLLRDKLKKVEELITRMLQFISEKDAFIMPSNAEWKQMLNKAREVEAALGGKAE